MERFLFRRWKHPPSEELRGKEKMLIAAQTTLRNSGAEATAAQEPALCPLGEKATFSEIRQIDGKS